MNHQDTKDTKNGKMKFENIDPELDKIAAGVVDAAYKIHRHFGPGLLESAYEACLFREMQKRGFEVERQVEVPLIYDNEKIEIGFRIDLLVQDRLIVELKAVESLQPIHEAQVLTYLRIMNQRLGLLINFNVPLIKNGIKRIIL
ncbi:MAG TPA: GxxExxY protein [bacterium]|nr:GxxExxY protein [bacterium]